MTLTRILSVAAAGAALAFAPVAMTSVAAQEAAQESQSEAVPGELLDAFVLAAIDVAEVQQTYAASYESAEDDDARQGIVEEAQNAMITAVEDADGITVEEYLRINDAAQTDQELNQRIQARLQDQTQPEE